MPKKGVLEGKPLGCTRFNGTITRKEKQHGKLSLIFNIISQISSKPTSEIDHPISSDPESRDEILFRREGCDTQVNSMVTL
jgi:hypothetical protein